MRKYEITWLRPAVTGTTVIHAETEEQAEDIFGTMDLQSILNDGRAEDIIVEDIIDTAAKQRAPESSEP